MGLLFPNVSAKSSTVGDKARSIADCENGSGPSRVTSTYSYNAITGEKAISTIEVAVSAHSSAPDGEGSGTPNRDLRNYIKAQLSGNHDLAAKAYECMSEDDRNMMDACRLGLENWQGLVFPVDDPDFNARKAATKHMQKHLDMAMDEIGNGGDFFKILMPDWEEKLGADFDLNEAVLNIVEIPEENHDGQYWDGTFPGSDKGDGKIVDIEDDAIPTGLGGPGLGG